MHGQRLDCAEIAELLLNGVAAHYAANTNPDVEALPARRLVLAGDAATYAWDCEMLAVSMQGVGFGASNDTGPTTPQLGVAAGALSVRHVPFEVSLIRCIETGDESENLKPPDTVLFREGMRFLRDMGMLSQALVEIGAKLRPQLGPGGLVRAGECLPAGPDGQFVAVVGLFTVSSTRLVS